MPHIPIEQCLREARHAAERISLNVEELWRVLEEEPTLGDNGVAEAVARIENAIALVNGELAR